MPALGHRNGCFVSCSRRSAPPVAFPGERIRQVAAGNRIETDGARSFLHAWPTSGCCVRLTSIAPACAWQRRPPPAALVRRWEARERLLGRRGCRAVTTAAPSSAWNPCNRSFIASTASHPRCVVRFIGGLRPTITYCGLDRHHGPARPQLRAWTSKIVDCGRRKTVRQM